MNDLDLSKANVLGTIAKILNNYDSGIKPALNNKEFIRASAIIQTALTSLETLSGTELSSRFYGPAKIGLDFLNELSKNVVDNPNITPDLITSVLKHAEGYFSKVDLVLREQEDYKKVRRIK